MTTDAEHAAVLRRHLESFVAWYKSTPRRTRKRSYEAAIERAIEKLTEGSDNAVEQDPPPS